ncbi:MAG: RNA pseudouridine synthase [Legionellales bacterium]|nr:RNA pseudouridine synthase [Legionellales bacterium]OUX67294.1 MAG: hypothetical protein CBD38_02770 [bacterium TMED178]|tara:strand:+ start:2454 stop:3401 length:948 start_codon:yes stop_codon:yes gene_type:complete
MTKNKEISLNLYCDQSIRLDQFICQQCTQFSRAQIQDWIKNGQVLVNEQKIVKCSLKLKADDVIFINASLKTYTEDQPENIPINPIFEDDVFLVINKPKNMIVHPGAGNPSNTLLNALLHHYPENKNLPRAGIVHRLDKDTSGLMVIAKTSDAYLSLTQQLKSHHVSRIYECICYGQILQRGSINQNIGRHPSHRTKMGIREDGKSAITHYEITGRYKHFTKLKITLETGRTHQIRVHLSSIKHPILGDGTYGQKKLIKNAPEINNLIQSVHSQLLHATELSFDHPVTGEVVHFRSPSDEYFSHVIATLETFDSF